MSSEAASSSLDNSSINTVEMRPSVSDSGQMLPVTVLQNQTTEVEDPNYVVIYTPKAIISESDVAPTLAEAISFFYRKQEVHQSRSHILDRVHGELVINSSEWESQLISANASHSHVLPLPGNRSRVLIHHSHSQTIQLEVYQSRSRKLRWKTDQACQILTATSVGKRHIPPLKRIEMVQRLLEIRDLFVDVVVFLNSIGFGGKNFKWSPTVLEAFGVTKLPPLRIPEAFKTFASQTKQTN